MSRYRLSRRLVTGSVIAIALVLAAGVAALAWAQEPVSEFLNGNDDTVDIGGTPVPGAGRAAPVIKLTPSDQVVVVSTPTPIPTPIPGVTPETSPVASPGASPEASTEPPTPEPPTPAPEKLVVRSNEMITQLTGELAPVFEESWNVIGADLGFSFKHKGETYVVFGDTWGRSGGEGPDWRSNTMAIISEHPDQAYAITDMVKDGSGEAIELISSLKEPGVEYTVLPTSGTSVDGRMYMHFMSVNDWITTDWGYKGPAVNYTQIAYSDDDGHTWTKAEATRVEGDYAFAQTGMVQHDGYVYVFGTPAGRFGPVKLYRTVGDGLLDPETYEYWSADGWSDDPAAAANVAPAPVGELSVKWSEYHDRWLMMYLNDVTHNIVLRTAERLEGPWDEERDVMFAADHPTLYAPMLLPDIDSPDIYFIVSLFNYYNTFLAKATLMKE